MLVSTVCDRSGRAMMDQVVGHAVAAAADRYPTATSPVESPQMMQMVTDNRAVARGERPSIADFAFFAPVSDLLAQRGDKDAPAVLEWRTRLWNARSSDLVGDHLCAVPDDLGDMLSEIGTTYLPFLNAIHGATKAMAIEKAIVGLPMPLHPGAAKYYKVVGIKIPARLLAD